jgi:DNA polymerase elongation subunit (family B)
LYTNVSYFVDKSDNFGKVYLAGWDEDGHRNELIIPHKSHLYHEHPNGEATTIHGIKVTRKDFSNLWDRKKWIESHPSDKIYDCLKPEREFLVERFFQENESDEFNQYPLKVYFYDIEIAVPIGASFPEPALAEYPINVMTFFDSIEEHYHIFINTQMDVKFVDTSDTTYYVFGNEFGMLDCWSKWFMKYRPDIISGWNIDGFDTIYLVNRLYKNFEEDTVANILSPVGRIYAKHDLKHGKGIKKYCISGLTQIDYLYLYRDKFSNGPKDSFKLDDIGELEVGFGKLESPTETISEFWTYHFEKFVEYNKIDVQILVELDKKLQLISLTRQLCNIGLCEYESIYSTTSYIYGAIVNEAKRNHMVVLSDDRKSRHDEGYPGAYVFDPNVGCYRDTLFTVDFNSLYPSIMIALNMSPETKIGKIVSTNETSIDILNTQGKIKTITKDTFKKMLVNQDIVLAANKVLFINPNKKKGLIPAFQERLYERRKFYKNLAKQAKKEGLNNKFNQYTTTQIALKNILNSIYGLFGNTYFALKDVDIASAITLTGQAIIKHMSKEISGFINTNYNTNSNDNHIIYGDTDSCMVNSEAISKFLLNKTKNLNNDEIVKLSSHIDGIVENFNDLCFKYTQKQFNSPLKRILFSREKTCAGGIFLTKKKYILWIRDNEGTICDTFKYSGVDTKKKEISKKTRDKLEKIVEEGIRREISPTEYLKMIENIWDEYKILTPDDICFIKNYTTDKSDGSNSLNGFTKGAGSHARAATYFNFIVDKLELNNKYEKIKSGDSVDARLKLIYTQLTNEFGIDVIGWPVGNTFPKEFANLNINVDYFKMFEKTVMAPLKRFIQIFKWPNFNPNSIPEVDLFSL